MSEQAAYSFENSLQVSVVSRGEGSVVCRLDLHPGLMNGQGVTHGGIIASLADEAAWFALQHQFGPRARHSTTTELKVNYLRPITGSHVRADTTILRAGRTLTVSRVDMFDDQGKLAATATVTYMLLNVPSA